MLNAARARRRGQRGQVIVLFALSLVVIIAAVGLVLDGGSTYAQRRAEQNAADLAAIGGANDYLVNHDLASAEARAKSIAAGNGYVDGAAGTTVSVAIDLSSGARLTVGITSSHRNNFAGIVGMSSWDVSVTATALTGFPDTATGPGPFVLSRDNFGVDGTPIGCTDDTPGHGCTFTHPVSDSPQAASDFVWTNFGYDKLCEDPGNVNDSQLQDYLEGSAHFTITLDFGCYIAQHNSGVMNNTVAALATMTPVSFPIPVVDHNGNFTGWVSFMLTSADPGGRNGELTGYFLSPFNANQLTVEASGLGNTNFAGSYVLKLVN